ncbi:phosphatidate phosphatase PAH1 [Oryza brachyantha]|uniref:phosphatidate phosphatase n=1 Tax=Oryza brachyantha TaxID=4533 RepID=J3M7X5_ORYBR|nr:phosphatidate phosphatase PAH1 [Oryza brachyantha]
MNVVGRVGSLISQGVYSVATPFHPFGGAVDIIAVEQPDGSYRSTPWYVRFGKFQGVLKGAEKVVTITVNGVDANFHMLLDNSGQAYFMRELVPGSENPGTSSEEEEASSGPEPPVRSKSDGDLYMGTKDRPGSPELNVERQEKQPLEEFDSYSYSRLEVEEDSEKQPDGGNSEMVLVSVDGHVLTAPISSTEENMEDVQLSDPQFHLGPGESSSGDFSRSGEVWEAGIVGDLYIQQEKVKFDSGNQQEALEDLCDVPIEKDKSHNVPVNEDGVLHASVSEDLASVLTNEDEPLVVPESGNNDDNYQPLINLDEAYDILENKDEGCQPPNQDEVRDDSKKNNDEGYQPLATEDEACDVPLLENDETCHVPLLENDEACKVPASVGKVCDVSYEDTEFEMASPSFGKYDTFKSCLDLSSQIDDGDSGTEPFSPEFDHQRDSELSLSNRSVVDIDLEEDICKTTHFDRNGPLQYLEEEMGVSADTSDDKTENEDSSAHRGKESDMSCVEGSNGKTKEMVSSENEADKLDGLYSSIGTSDKDKLGSIPENSAAEEELNKEEHPKLHKGLGFEISLCGHILRPGMGEASAEEVFQQHLVLEDDLKLSGSSIMRNANLVVKFDSKYFLWSKISHIVLGKAVFGPNFCTEHIDAILVEHQETPSSRDSLGLSPSSRRWRLWPIPFRISRSLQRSNSDSSEDIFLDTETVLSPMDEQAPENNINQSPRKQFVRTLIPTSEQVASLNLKEGQNIVTFSFSTRVLGKQQVEAHIYLWKWNAKIVISDVDGTITRSDVLGQVMPLVGRDWSQSGVARLFSAIKENGYQLLFLSARAIVQAYLTKNFLFNLKQDGKVLPNGPVVISPDGLFPSLYREVIRRAPHEFKIACLEDIKALFPSDYNPFYAGFGNRDTDELSYKKMGIPKGKIFIINPKGEVAINSSVDVKSYTSLHTLVHDMFPPTTLVEQEDYNSWNYWRMPLPDVDL